MSSNKIMSGNFLNFDITFKALSLFSETIILTLCFERN